MRIALRVLAGLFGGDKFSLNLSTRSMRAGCFGVAQQRQTQSRRSDGSEVNSFHHEAPSSGYRLRRSNQTIGARIYLVNGRYAQQNALPAQSNYGCESDPRTALSERRLVSRAKDLKLKFRPDQAIPCI